MASVVELSSEICQTILSKYLSSHRIVVSAKAESLLRRVITSQQNATATLHPYTVGELRAAPSLLLTERQP